MYNSQGIDRAMKILSERSKTNELDHAFVMECLQDWKNPSMKLSRLLKQGALIGVKKELYVFAPFFRKTVLSLPVIANKMLGPSYVSLEWALNFYGLIPEYVATVTSITTKVQRSYDTPLGRFTYDHIRPSAYPCGIVWLEQPGGGHALIASREKALADLLRLRRGRVRSQKEIEAILLEDLRIEEEDLKELNLSGLEKIYTSSPHSAVMHLITYLKRLAK